MDRFILLIILYGLLCYFIGFFFNKKIFSRTFLFPLWKKWNDWIIIVLYLLIAISGLVFYFGFTDELEAQKFFIADLTQSEIFFATLFTLIYSTLLKDKASSYRDRPIINLEFNDRESEHFHKTLMTIQTRLLVQQQNFTNIIPLVDSVPAYYVRLKVINRGRIALTNTEVIIEKVESKKKTTLLRPFMPLNLYWSFAEERERVKINIPPHNAFRIIDFIELTNPQQTEIYSNKLSKGAIDYDRYKALVTGFRVCTVPPNTLSDIFEKGSYVFTIGIYSNNAEPAYKKFLVEYDGEWDDNSMIMRIKHLKVKPLNN